MNIHRGDLFEAAVEALVNPVHCAGIMKRGLCRQFKARFPENTKRYKAACDDGTLRPGDVLIYDRGGLFAGDDQPQYILNVATKDHWTDSATLPNIEQGVEAVVDEIAARDVDAVAIPALGCGGGGLDWPDVRPLLTHSLAPLDETRVAIYAPRSSGADAPPDGGPTDWPAMTTRRALLLATLDAYASPDTALHPHAAQNLAYLLQCAGENLHLQFEPGRRGPHAPGLTAVLRRVTGYFVHGYDPEHPNAPFHLRPSAVSEAKDVVTALSTAADRLEHVQSLLGGRSSDDDLAALATVLWITRHNPKARRGTEAAVQALHDRNDRTSSVSRERIPAAWRRLRDQGWID